MKNQGNIVFKEIYGKNNHALLKCKTCKHCFSETRGTVFFGLGTSHPVFTSDDWDAVEEGLVNVYGKTELNQYKGSGRKPLPKLIPVEGLKYIKYARKK